MLFRKGWFLRKNKGLPWGVDLEIDWIRLKIPKPNIIFDVGAHKGESMDRFQKIFPEAFCFSFEPVAMNYKNLVERFKESDSCKCFQIALGDSYGDADIKLGSDSQTHSLKTAPSASSGEKERVQVSTVDLTMAQLKIEKIDLLKIDTEGYELKVLHGASTALKNHRICAILCEATLDSSDLVHTSLIDLCRHLEPIGYDLLAIYDQNVWAPPARLVYFNALFLSRIISRKL